ncbi:MAG: 50S ribosomal protein L40e [Candidatus Aenigmarchaeota archaeon]|nr:50S ribosomal protein L40e [Candidatus Aenigmarchaeota archaeon]
MAKKKFPELEQRLFKNVYICMRCNAKMKTDLKKISTGKVKCRRCGYKFLRLKNKDIKV